jgi:DNA-binding transcriptional MerR regulator
MAAVRELIHTKDLAAELGVAEETLRGWRWRGIGPVSYKVGNFTVYDRADVEAWLEAQKQRTGVGAS